MRNNQFVLVQFSVKDKNHFAPKMLGILDGPQILVCVKEKGLEDFVLLNGNDT